MTQNGRMQLPEVRDDRRNLGQVVDEDRGKRVDEEKYFREDGKVTISSHRRTNDRLSKESAAAMTAFDLNSLSGGWLSRPI